MFLTLTRFLGPAGHRKGVSIAHVELFSGLIEGAHPSRCPPSTPEAVAHGRVPWVSLAVSQKTLAPQGRPTAFLAPGMGNRDIPGHFCFLIQFWMGMDMRSHRQWAICPVKDLCPSDLPFRIFLSCSPAWSTARFEVEGPICVHP